MRIIQRARYRSQQRDDAERFITLARFEHVVEGLAGDHLGDQVRRLALIGKLVEARDGLVLERDIGAELEEEPAREADIARNVRADGPHGDPSLQARMFSLIYRPKAVCLELTQHAVPAHVVMAVACGLWAGAVPFFSHET